MNKRYDILIVDVIVAMILFICVALFSGCSTEWAMVKLDKSPVKSAEYCGIRYPVDSFFTEGETILRTDTIYYPIFVPDKSTNKVDTIIQEITKYYHSTDTIGIVNNSAISLIEAKYEDLMSSMNKLITSDRKRQDKYDKLQEGRNIWRIIGLGAIVVIIACVMGYLIPKSKII